VVREENRVSELTNESEPRGGRKINCIDCATTDENVRAEKQEVRPRSYIYKGH
jgi:hypothetical protein